MVGATGLTGRELLKQALAAGHEPTALARDAGKLADLPDIPVVVGDVLQPASLTQAFVGQEAVLSALGGAKGSPPDIRSKGLRNVIDAMRQQDVRRLVALSALGAGDSRGQSGFVHSKVIAPLFLKKILADQTAMEEVVRSSGLQWTLVRATRLTNGPASGKAEVMSRGGGMASKVSRTDIATFMVQQLSDLTYVGKTPGLTT